MKTLKINLPLLKKQRKVLIKICLNKCIIKMLNSYSIDRNYLDGILNMLDDIEDELKDESGVILEP